MIIIGIVLALIILAGTFSCGWAIGGGGMFGILLGAVLVIAAIAGAKDEKPKPKGSKEPWHGIKGWNTKYWDDYGLWKGKKPPWAPKGGQMKAIVLLLAALSASCVPGPHVEADIGISVTETEGGVTVENTASVACIVVVESPEGEQRCDLPVGESVTVTGITGPVDVGAVSP